VTIGYENDANLPDPADLHIWMQLAANGTFVDVSQYVDITSVNLAVPANGKTGTLTFTIRAPGNLIGGSTYVIDDNVETRVEEWTDSGPYHRHFMGWTTEVVSRTEGYDKVYEVTAQTPGAVLARPGRQVVTPWPTSEGTPVVDTTVATALTSTGSQTVAPASVYNLYVDRTVFASNANGTAREYITITGKALTVDTTGQDPVTTIGTPVTVTPVSMSGISDGSLLTVYNADAGHTNREVVTASGVTGTTFVATFTLTKDDNFNIEAGTVTATFAKTKTANWLIYGGLNDKDILADGFQIGDTSYAGFIDEYFNKAKYTTVALGATAGSNVTVTPASMVDIFPRHSLIIADENGGNEETIVVESVDYNAGTFVIRTLVNTRATNWRVYNNIYVSKNAISEVIRSVPHLTADTGEPVNFIDKLRENAVGEQIVSTTSSASFSPGTRLVTTASMADIYPGQYLMCQNADGTNREVVFVIGTSATQFQATFRMSKTGSTVPWKVEDTPDVVDYAMVWTPDNGAHDAAWDLILAWYNPFDVTTLASVALVDTATVTAGASARYTDPYNRTIDGGRRGYKASVKGKNEVVGTYTDPVVPRGKRLIELPVVVDDTIGDADTANLRAKQHVRSFKYPSEHVQVSTYARITTSLFYQANSVSWQHENEGGTPAQYAIADKRLSFPQGAALYTFTLGQAWEEIGDRPQPRFGAVNLRDVAAPSIPTWASGTGWLLSNTYNPQTGLTDVHIQWNSGREADLNNFRVYYRVTGNTSWGVWPPVDYPTHDVTLNLNPNVGYDFSLKAVDNSGNMSDRSAVVSTTTQSVQNPDPITSLSVTRNVFYGQDGMAHLFLSWVASVSSGVHHVEFLVRQGTNQYWTHNVDTPNTTTEIIMQPGVAYEIYGVAVTTYNHRSVASNTVSGTTAAAPDAIELYNGDFAFESLLEANQPDGWTITTGGTLALINAYRRHTGAVSLRGKYYYEIDMLGSGVGSAFVELLSRPVAVVTTGGSISTANFSMIGGYIYRATAAFGTILSEIRFYDKADSLVYTETIQSSATPSTAGAVHINKKSAGHADMAYARLYIKFTSGTTATIIRFGGCKLEESVSGGSVNSSFVLDSGDALTMKSGTELNITSNTATPIEFYDSDNTSLRARLNYAETPDYIILEGVETDGVAVAVRVQDSSGQMMFIRPSTGIEHSVFAGKTYTVNDHRVLNVFNTVCFDNAVVCFDNSPVVFGDD
jgi:hypothetical protein